MSGVIVVKYGGSAMEDSAKVSEILQEIVGLTKEGFSVVLVHGGGKRLVGRWTEGGSRRSLPKGFG